MEEAIRSETGQPGMLMASTGAVSTVMRDENCVYLSSTNRCRIHGSLGAQAKPLTCQQFPFLLTRCPDGVVVGASFFCPAVQQNLGPPLASYRSELETLLLDKPIPSVGEHVRVAAEQSIPYAEFLEIESYVLDLLAGDFKSCIAKLMAVLLLPRDGQRWQDQITRVDTAILADPILEYLHGMNMIGFVDRAEMGQGAVVNQALTGAPIEFRTLGFKVSLPALQEYAAGITLPWLQAHKDRYFRALLFRKFLAQPPGLLENLLALSVLPGVIETYTFASALARGAHTPEPADFFVGVERCEKDLVTHGLESQVMTGSYLRFFRQRWEQIRGATD